MKFLAILFNHRKKMFFLSALGDPLPPLVARPLKNTLLCVSSLSIYVHMYNPFNLDSERKINHSRE